MARTGQILLIFRGESGFVNAANNKNISWDGTFKGTKVPEGAYIYTAEIIDIIGQYHFLSGNITLVR